MTKNSCWWMWNDKNNKEKMEAGNMLGLDVKLSLARFMFAENMAEVVKEAASLVDAAKIGDLGKMTTLQKVELLRVAKDILDDCNLNKHVSATWRNDNVDYFYKKVSNVDIEWFRNNGDSSMELFESLTAFRNGDFNFRTIQYYMDGLIQYADRHTEGEVEELLRKLKDSFNIISSTLANDAAYDENKIQEERWKRKHQIYKMHLMQL